MTERARKLVRDNIPDLLTDEMRAKNPTFARASALEFRKYILDKIVEEARELRNVYDVANDSFDFQKMCEEMADLMLATGYVKEFFNLSNRSIGHTAVSKSSRNGMFDLGLIMEYDSDTS